MSQNMEFRDIDEIACILADGGRSEARDRMASLAAETFIRDLTTPENLNKLKNELVGEMCVATDDIGYDLDEPVEIMQFVLKAARKRLVSFADGLADEGFDEYEAKHGYGRHSDAFASRGNAANADVVQQHEPIAIMPTPSGGASAEKQAPCTPAPHHDGHVATVVTSEINITTNVSPRQPAFMAPVPIAPSLGSQPVFVAPPMPPPSAPNRSPVACEPAQSTLVDDDDESPEDVLVNRKAQALLTQRLPRSRADALGMEDARKLVPEVEEAVIDLAIWDLFDKNIVGRAKRTAPFAFSKFWVCEPDDTVPVSHMRLFEELMAWPSSPGEARHATPGVQLPAASRGTPSPIPSAIAEARKPGSTR